MVLPFKTFDTAYNWKWGKTGLPDIPLPETTGLIDHFRAQDLLDTLDNNDPVSSWVGTEGAILSSTGANRPTFITDVHKNFPAVKYNGTNNFSDSDTDIGNLGAITIYIVANWPSTITNANTFQTLFANQSVSLRALVGWGEISTDFTNERFCILSINSADVTLVGMADTANDITAGVHNFIIDYDGTTTDPGGTNLFLANVDQALTVKGGGSGGLTSTRNLENIDRIGIARDGTSRPLDLELIELITYNIEHSTAQRNNMYNNYISRLYGAI